jgi:hypothetical protein
MVPTSKFDIVASVNYHGVSLVFLDKEHVLCKKQMVFFILSRPYIGVKRERDHYDVVTTFEALVAQIMTNTILVNRMVMLIDL